MRALAWPTPNSVYEFFLLGAQASGL